MESKEIKKIRMAKYYLENRKRILARNKRWSLSHKAQHAKLIDDWNRNNKDRKNSIAKAWEAANPEKRRVIHRRWCQRNPLKCAVMSAQHRALKAKAAGRFTAKEFESLCRKYNNKCLCCCTKKALTADHIRPLVAGGSNYISNIQPLCRPCNSRKGTKTIDYRKQPEGLATCRGRKQQCRSI